jgi:hypothetical protein
VFFIDYQGADTVSSTFIERVFFIAPPPWRATLNPRIEQPFFIADELGF